MQQVGTVNVGSSTTDLKQITVPFAQAFTTVPVVVANTLQQSKYPEQITDTFAVSIASVSPTQFQANIYRVDQSGPGWGQNLSLGYVATTP